MLPILSPGFGLPQNALQKCLGNRGMPREGVMAASGSLSPIDHSAVSAVCGAKVRNT